MGQLSKLRQTSIVVVYMAQFESLMNEITVQSEDALINFFLAGLKSEIQEFMLIHMPTTLRRALVEAKILEARQCGKGFKGGGYITAKKSELLLKTPPASGTTVPIVRRTLTIEERRERTVKGLFFNCDEQYAPGHRCKGRLFRLNAEQECLIEVVDPTT